MPEQEEITLRGLAASPGVAHGPIFLIHQKELDVPRYVVPKEKREDEVLRFEQAILETRLQISQTRSEVAEKVGEEEAQIFDAHLLVLDDKALLDETVHEFEESGLNIEHCFQSVASRYMEAFTLIDDEYLRERVADIRDVTRRLQGNLLGKSQYPIDEMLGKRIIVSEDLTPSETATFDVAKVLGIATDAGGPTSHVVIMARSIEVPAVVGLHNISDVVNSGDTLLIDGYGGIVIVNPTEQSLRRYGKIKLKHQHQHDVFEAGVHEPATTRDGHDLILRANIEGYEDTNRLKDCGADGVGLFRTEAVFLRVEGFPSEEEQFEVYRHVVEDLSPQPVTIRTLDLGGDKGHHGEYFPKEDNPFMGFRGIRFCLDQVDVFKNQLRAILRASAYGKVKIMYPMISGKREMVQARRIFEETKEDLKAKGQAFDPKVEQGSMIEVPSAALTADLLARECEFFSIGTNDLVQYILAVDRVNDRVDHLYDPNHPAVLRTLKNVIDAAHRNRIPVAVCGEMAGDPVYTALLFGLGADELSATPGYLPEIKYLIRKMELSDAKRLADEVLQFDDSEEVYPVLRKYYTEHLGAAVMS